VTPDDLKQAYLSSIPALEAIEAKHAEAYGPHLISVPAAYYATDVRLMIVGQQARYWPSVTLGLDGLLDAYKAFDLARNTGSSPFWQASHTIAQRVNPNGPERAFLWTNLIKMDEGEGRPNAALEEAVCKLGLLNREIELLRPDVVVFFTGPSYDARLSTTFPGLKYHEITKGLAQLDHCTLPTKSYRTYHPKHLWIAKKRALLDDLTEAIAAARLAKHHHPTREHRSTA